MVNEKHFFMEDIEHSNNIALGNDFIDINLVRRYNKYDHDYQMTINYFIFIFYIASYGTC